MIVSFFMPQTTKKKGRAPSARPLSYIFTWEDFVFYLRQCSEEPAPKSYKQTGTVEVNAFGMAIYAADTQKRGNDVALAADWIGLDIDDKDGDTGAWKFDHLVQFVADAGVAFAAYTTTSSTADRHCLRLILPFDRQVWAEEWPIVWASFAAWIGQVDTKTSDVARILYEPRLWEGAYNRFYASPPELPFVCVNDIVDRYAPPPSRETVPERRRRAHAALNELRLVSNLDDLDTSPIIKPDWIDEACCGRTGGRMYRFLCRVAMSARAQEIALDAHELTGIGYSLAARMGRKENSDIRRDAERALSWSCTTYIGPRQTSVPNLPPAWPWS